MAMELSKALGPSLRLPLRFKAPTTRILPRASSFTLSIRYNSSETNRAPSRSTPSAAPRSSLASLISSFRNDARPSPPPSSSGSSNLSKDKNAPLHDHPMEPQPWHLHIFSTKHNTHLTLTRPNRKAVISISSGNIGFRKAQRGSYDAAYQLGAYMIARINRAGLLSEMHELEIVFRGFGNGREAVGKLLLGSEGSVLRPLIKKVGDATRLKFGGTRSRKPRRLG